MPTGYTAELLEGKQTPQEWKQEKLSSLKRDLEYYADEFAKGIERNVDKNEWIAHMHKSVKGHFSNK